MSLLFIHAPAASLAALRQMAHRLLFWLVMTLSVALLATTPVRASWTLSSTATPLQSTVTGGFPGSFTLNAVAPDATYLANGYNFFLDYAGESFPTEKLVTFNWTLKEGTLYPGNTRFSYTLDGGSENVIKQGGGGSGQTSIRLAANRVLGFKMYGSDGAQLDVTSITVSDPPPVLSSITRSSGSRSGGDNSNQVVLYGTGFTSNSTVWFGSVQAQIAYQDATSIYVVFPPANATGPVNVTVKENGLVSNSQTFTYTKALLWTVGSPRSITASVTQPFTPITPVTTYPAHEGEGAITWSIAPLSGSPALSTLGLTINPQNGQISAPSGSPTGTCAQGSGGNCDYEITLTDSAGQKSSQNFQIYVTAPALVLPQQGQTYVFNYNANGSAAPFTGTTGGWGARTYNIVSGALPSGLSFDASNGTISGASTQVGDVAMIVSISDQANYAELRFTLSVKAPPITPLNGTPGDQVLTYGVQASITPFIAQGGYGAFTYTLKSGTLQSGLAFNNGVISGKPVVLGDQQITITATDGAGQTQDYAFKLSVVAPGFTATPSTATPAFTVGTQGSFTPFASVSGSVGSVVYSISPALPSGLGLAFDPATGVISGKPLRVLGANDAKAFTITATDQAQGLSGRTSTRSITLAIAQGAANVALTASSLTPKYGAPVTLTATVSGGGATPGGTVDFMDGSVKLGTVAVTNGVASFTVTGPLKSGPHAMKAVWSGDANYVANASAIVTVTSGRPDPTTDRNVRLITALQAATVQRVASAQISNLSQRLETLHQDEVPNFVNGISISAPQQATPNAFEDPLKQNSLADRTHAGQALNGSLKIDERMQAKASDRSFGKLEGSRYKVWTAGSVIFGGVNVSSLGVETKTHFTLGSLTAGMDTQLMENVKGGFAVSYSSDSNDIGTDGSRLNSRSVASSLYASWKLTDRFFLDGSVGYGGISFDSKRFDGNAAAFITGDRHGRLLFGSLALSYDVKNGPLSYAPYARLDVIDANLAAYTEQGDANWTLAYDRSTMGSKSMVLGLRGEYAIAQNWGVLSPTARFEYRRMLSGDVTQMMSYANEPGTTYSLTTTGADRDMFSASLGLIARSDSDVTGAVEYVLSGAPKNGLQGQGLRGRLRIGF